MRKRKKMLVNEFILNDVLDSPGSSLKQSMARQETPDCRHAMFIHDVLLMKYQTMNNVAQIQIWGNLITSFIASYQFYIHYY